MAIRDIALKHLEKGKEYYKRGEFKNAIRCFNICLSMNMHQTQCYLYIGISYYYMLNLSQALHFLQMITSINSSSEDAYYFLGHIFKIFENDKESLSYYKKAILESKNQAYCLLAYNKIESLLDIPDRGYYLEKAVQSYIVKINTDEYEENLQKGLTSLLKLDYEKAIEIFEQNIEEYPRYFESYYYLIEVYKKVNKYKEAKECYQVLNKKFPLLKLSYIDKAKNYFHLEEYSKSVIYLKKVIQILPLSHKVYFNLGMLYNLLKKNEKAAAAYQQSIELKDNFYPSYYNLAVTYYKMGKVRDSLKQYHRACIIEPGSYHVYYNMGMIYYENKDYVNALFNLNKAYQLNPQFIEAYNNFQHIGLLRNVDINVIQKVGYSSVLKFSIVIVLVLICLTVLWTFGVL